MFRQNFNTGISDCHHIIGSFIQAKLPPSKQSEILCRSYKNFHFDSFLTDLLNIDLPPSVSVTNSECMNENYTNFEKAFVHVAYPLEKTAV